MKRYPKTLPLFENNKTIVKHKKDVFFYKKEKRHIVPVLDPQLNKKAKAELRRMLKSHKTLGIPKRYLKNWNEVALYHPSGDLMKANAILLDPTEGAYSIDNKLNDLTGKQWTKFTKSWFTFDAIASDLKEEKEITKKANLSTEDHPATYSPTLMSEFISFFTKENQTVFDPFAGIGTTLVGCDRTNRKGIGIELNPKYVKIIKLRTKQKIIKGDSRNLNKIFRKHKIKSIDFSISSPPYWNILNRSTGSFEKNRKNKNLDIQYSDDKIKDIGNITDYNIFLERASDIYLQLYDYLKIGGYLVVIVKNIKKSGKQYTLAWDLAKSLSSKYSLKDERIWCQDKVGLSPFGYPFAWTSNIVHHYCLIFRKDS